MPANILNLVTYEVCRIDSDDHNDHIEVVVAVAPAACQACDSESIVGFGRREQFIKDIPSRGKRVASILTLVDFSAAHAIKPFMGPCQR